MKRATSSIALVFVLLLSTLTVTFPFSTVHASTNVSGKLTSDATWNKANSPYMFTAPVDVPVGITLTIEAGVTININDYYLQIDGTLRAIGTNIEPINISSTSAHYGTEIRFTQNSTSWNEQTSSGSIIDNAVINLHDGIGATKTSPKINNNTIYGSISISQCSSIITNNIIATKASSAIYGSGAPIIWNNTVTGGGIDVLDNLTDSGQSGGGLVQIVRNVITGNGGIGIIVYSCYISDNIISGWDTGIQVSGYTLIQRNLIQDNNLGIKVINAQAILNNTIRNNNVGIDSPTLINFNNIQNNTQHNLYMWTVYNTNATYNWWGTTDVAAINQTIIDSKADFHLGTVIFAPILSQPNPEAMPDPNAALPLLDPSTSPSMTASPQTSPSPTPSTETTSTPTTLIETTPVPTLSPTPTKSAPPSQSPTPTPSQNSSTLPNISNNQGVPSEVFYAIVAVFVALFVVLSAAVVVLFRRTRKSQTPKP